MDLPVVLIKFRDYIFWFGPAYLVALLLSATTEVILRRTLKLPPAGGEGKQTQPEADLLPALWERLSVSIDARQPLSLRLYIWLTVMSASASWVALLMTGVLSWALSLLRIGIAFIFAAALATLVPLVAGSRKELQAAAPGRIGDTPTPAPPIHIEWWRALNYSFSKSSNQVIAGAALGGALIGLTVQLYGFLHFVLGTPAAYLFAPVIATLTTLTPGTDAPLLAAMQAKELEPGVVALMLAVSVTPFGLLRKLKEDLKLEVKAIVAYVLLAWLLVAVIAWLLDATGLIAGVL